MKRPAVVYAIIGPRLLIQSRRGLDRVTLYSLFQNDGFAEGNHPLLEW